MQNYYNSIVGIYYSNEIRVDIVVNRKTLIISRAIGFQEKKKLKYNFSERA